MTKFLLAACVIAAISAPAFAQAPNDIASKLSRGRDYSEGIATRHREARARRHHSSTARSSGDHSAADQLNQDKLAKTRP